MEHDVLGVDGEIEDEKPEQRRDREPQIEIMEQPDAVTGGIEQGADRRRRSQASLTTSASTTTMPRLLGQRAARPAESVRRGAKYLPRRHDREHGDRDQQANGDLYGRVHGAE